VSASDSDYDVVGSSSIEINQTHENSQANERKSRSSEYKLQLASSFQVRDKAS